MVELEFQFYNDYKENLRLLSKYLDIYRFKGTHHDHLPDLYSKLTYVDWPSLIAVSTATELAICIEFEYRLLKSNLSTSVYDLKLKIDYKKLLRGDIKHSMSNT